jgi:rRNA maturation RNase YbeY
MFTFNYFNIPRTLSRTYCTRALEALEKVVKKPQKGSINLIVVSLEEMAQMNQQFRGKEGPTDILTFSYYDSEKQKKVVSVIPESWNASEVAWKISGIQVNKLSRSETLKSSGMDSTSRSPALPTGKQARLAGMTETVAWEIYLCLEKIRYYAQERGHTYREELEYIIIHGLTHLMGYDHENDTDWQEMEKVEKKIQSLIK